MPPAVAVSTAPPEPGNGRNCDPLLDDRAAVSSSWWMPSPVGHALGGIAAGCLCSQRQGWRALTAFAIAGALPDADFLLPVQHRGPSHSLGAALMLFGGALALCSLGGREVRSSIRLAGALALAYASHVLLDWLGTDSSSPRGLMALWPVSSAYYVSGLDVFSPISRRYWLPGFLWSNTKAVLREIAILGPLLALLFWRRTRRKHSAPRAER